MTKHLRRLWQGLLCIGPEARLVTTGVMPRVGRRNHNIKAYWDALHAASPGDEKLLETIRALKPFVDSLSRIDNDGQELRYHLNRSDDPSLADFSLANLKVIRASLTSCPKLFQF